MAEAAELTPDHIAAMNYNELISIVQETNRPPGGFESIRTIALQAFLGPGKAVLEIGTSTGYSAIELAALTRARITAIDVNARSLSVATERAHQAGVSEYIQFEQQDAHALTYPDNAFDLVLCGNVTSLLAEPERALKEYARVCKGGGFVAAIPMYYITAPPAGLVERVSAAIQVSLQVRYQDYWKGFFVRPGMELCWSRDYAFDDVSEGDVGRYVDELLQRPHLQGLEPETAKALQRVYSRYMMLFRENLTYMGFSILLLRKAYAGIEPQLFAGHRL